MTKKSSSTILLTRGTGLNQGDRQMFEKVGWQTVTVPLSVICPLPITPTMAAAIRQADWLVFTSQAPVIPVLQEAKLGVQIAAIGTKTAQAVANAGFPVTLISPQENKKALADELKAKLPHGAKIVYGKSQLADRALEEDLAADFQVTSFVVYENKCPRESREKLWQLLAKGQVQAVYLTSPSAWQRFKAIYEAAPRQTDAPLQLVAIGATTLAAIETAGYQGILKKDWLAHAG